MVYVISNKHLVRSHPLHGGSKATGAIQYTCPSIPFSVYFHPLLYRYHYNYPFTLKRDNPILAASVIIVMGDFEGY